MTGSTLGRRADFQTLVDQLHDVAIWTASEPGGFDYISDGFEDIWGIPPATVEDDLPRLYETIHPEDRDRVRSRIERPPSEVTAETYESRVVRPDGEVRWVQVRQVSLRDERGELTEVIGISADITTQKRRERELEALNRIVRHDIRNDMQVVLGWAEMLADHVDEQGEEYREKITTTGEHVVELTQVARDYVESLTGADGAEMSVGPTSLRQVLLEEVDRKRETYPEATFEVESDVPDVDVMANEMLGSAFGNVLNNAVQHNDGSRPTVTVTCATDGADVRVRIADDGPGIPDGQKEAVFGKEAKGLDSAGTGIGLYLVRMLVEGYGGEVWIEDREPTGTEVHFRLVTAD